MMSAGLNLGSSASLLLLRGVEAHSDPRPLQRLGETDHLCCSTVEGEGDACLRGLFGVTKDD